MKASGSTPTMGLSSRPRPRSTRRVFRATAITVVAISAAACGQAARSASPTTTTASKHFLQLSGTGDKAIAAMPLPSRWTLAWKFDCQSPGTTGTFQLLATRRGGTPVSVTNQTGLGGGGQKPFTQSGTFSFAVKTTCSWKVSTATTPRTAAESATTAVGAGATTSKP